MKYHIMLANFIFIITSLTFSQNQSPHLEAEINQFLDEWHQNAKDAEMAYFDKIAENGIYIGTDKTELWSKAEFKKWSAKYFESGNTWDFTTIDRNIYFSADSSIAWFDELLDTHMGDCRSSGVMQRTDTGWEIMHYHLSVAVPNEVLKEVVKTIKNFED